MKKETLTSLPYRLLAATGLAVVLILGTFAPAAAKDKDDIEKVVELLIEAFRTGEYDAVVPHFARDITVVASAYAPPIEGVEDILRAYQVQREQVGPAEMIREGTKIARKGKTAWVSFRWQYAVNLERGLYGFEGHTTLVLEKRRRRWVIVHNHTSALAPPRPDAPSGQ